MLSEWKIPWLGFIYCRYTGPWGLQCSREYKNPPLQFPGADKSKKNRVARLNPHESLAT